MNKYKFIPYLVLSVALVGFALGVYLVFDVNPLAETIVRASVKLADTSVSLFNQNKARSRNSAKASYQFLELLHKNVISNYPIVLGSIRLYYLLSGDLISLEKR